MLNAVQMLTTVHISIVVEMSITVQMLTTVQVSIAVQILTTYVDTRQDVHNTC